MSAKLLGAAWAADMGTHARHLLLLKLVDEARDDGRHILEPLESMAKAARVSERHARREFRLFEAAGLLRCVGNENGGRGNIREYELDLDVLERCAREGFNAVLAAADEPVDASEKGDSVSAFSNDEKGDIHDRKGGHPTHEKGDIHDTSLNPLIEPLETPRESAGAGARPEGAPGAARTPTADASPVIERRAARKRFRQVCERYPKAALDKLDKAEALFRDLAEADQLAFVEAIDRVVAFLDGQKHRPPLQDFIAGKRWELIPRPDLAESATVDDGSVEVTRFSRGYWAMFWRCVSAGTSPEVVIGLFSRGKWVGAERQGPGEAEERALAQIAVKSPEFEAWREHVITRWPELRFRYPRPDFAQFAWVPSPWPEGTSAGTGDGAALSVEDEIFEEGAA